jgi:hypothetical protein
MHLFKYLGRNKYEYLGEVYPYQGNVLWKGSDISISVNGKFERYKK